MKIRELYSLYKSCYKVTTDTRLNLESSIFFALKGDNFNGNIYAEEALKKGALYAVVDEKQYQTNDKIILVSDALKTLQNLANFHRKQLNIPVIALTGSNGKTTTKELIYAVLKEKYNCIATKGNFNNHIGVPLTLLTIKPGYEIAVIEMGANNPKEIAALCEITEPDYGYITNFGRVHLEGFGSLEGVIKAKTEMYNYLNNNNKSVFVNTDDKVQMEKSTGMKRITFGNNNSDYPIQFINANPFVNLKFDNSSLQSKLIGKYNYQNIATAIAIGKFFKVYNEQIINGITNYIPSNNRSQIIIKNSNKIILDAYNANPNSMEAALENLSQLTDKNKIAVLGDMFEVGINTLQEHQNIAYLINNFDIDKAFLIGETFAKIEVNNNKIMQFKTLDDLKNHLDGDKITNTTLLIKASRGMALERMLNLL